MTLAVILFGDAVRIDVRSCAASSAFLSGWIAGLYAQLFTSALEVLAPAGASAVGADGFIAALRLELHRVRRPG